MNCPVCPHCGFKFTDEHIWHDGDGCDFPSEPGGETSDCFFCPGCGKELYVEVDWEPSFSFINEDGNEIYYNT